jgi:hypothetical protein
MGVALFIVPENEVEDVDTFVNGKVLAHCHPAGVDEHLDSSAESHLDALAREAGVRPLMEFFSQDPEEALAALEEFDAEPPPGGLSPEEWFPASEGLATVRGLLAHLAANPGAAANVDALIEDLRQFESVLSQLETAGVRWHLAVDY